MAYSPNMTITTMGIKRGSLFVLCGILDYSKTWPPYLTYDDKEYEFSNNTAMPNECVGHYGGCAEYKIVKSNYCQKGNDTMTVKETTKTATAAKPSKVAATRGKSNPKKPAVKSVGKAAEVKATRGKSEPVKPVTKTKAGKVATAKVVPAPKNTADTRKNVAKPLPPKKNDDKIAANIKAASAKKAAPAKVVVGIAKTITVDQLLNFAKTEKTLSQGGKFVQVLQLESSRKVLSFKLSAPVKVNGELVSSVKLNNTDILLLDAEAAKVFRHIDGGANVALKFKRI